MKRCWYAFFSFSLFSPSFFYDCSLQYEAEWVLVFLFFSFLSFILSCSVASNEARQVLAYVFGGSHAATHCNTLQHTATHCNTLQHTVTATHCNTLQHTATYCNILQHTATLCNTHTSHLYSCHDSWLQGRVHHTLQHAATRCNTLQHTVAHCNNTL